ncbi:hypothetical protein G6F24_014836 [Rhizopus arrhizus]|nr:hypothetical protein G6F24_014836 [Rhizopus arrhizus]
MALQAECNQKTRQHGDGGRQEDGRVTVAAGNVARDWPRHAQGQVQECRVRAQRRAAACVAARNSMQWLLQFSKQDVDCSAGGSNAIVVAAPAPCAGLPAAQCITVTVSYDYAGHPFLPGTATLYGSTSAAAPDDWYRRRFHAQVDPHRRRRPDRPGRAAGRDCTDARPQARRAGTCGAGCQRGPAGRHGGRSRRPAAGRRADHRQRAATGPANHAGRRRRDQHFHRGRQGSGPGHCRRQRDQQLGPRAGLLAAAADR